nr:unnamed protein product [Callosobruchus analis]
MLKKGGIKPKALVEDEINTIVEWIEDDCGLTLKQVKIKVLANFRKNVSISTIGNYLDVSVCFDSTGHGQMFLCEGMGTFANTIFHTNYNNNRGGLFASAVASTHRSAMRYDVSLKNNSRELSTNMIDGAQI